MIQNILTFCVKNDLTYVSGSIPSGKLVANDVNRNSIYLITPYDEAIVKANFQTNLQSDTPTSVLGILVNGEIEVGELVDTNASYYNLVKDWNIYEFKVPSTTLSFISRNRTGKIGINFSIEQRLVSMIKVSYGTYKGEITELAQTPIENGYYIIKALGYEYQDSIELKSFDLNDILVYNATTDVATKISAYSNRGSSPTALYSVDPSLLNDNFETITPSLTAQIVQQVNDNTGDILLLNQGVLNDGVAITDLQNRMSVAESDIDGAENTIVNLQGRMATAESDIDKIENGTTIVEKALRDSAGNVIKNHYVASVIPTYDDNTNNFYLNPYNGDDGLMPTRIEGVNLPKATTSKDGLMAKEDKVKVDNIASDISSAITTHDGSLVAHLHLRTLINDLQKEIDRLNAKGRSWGEVDKTFSELWAMAEPTRSEYITDYLLIEFPDFVATDGDLVYTKNTDTEEEHELEFNSALSQWVDNGAYIVGKASNTQMGIVKGDLTYVSILNGIIQVLKSDYATNVGSSGASYDYDDLLALFTEVANDIYKKNETYSATQIEQRITDLLGLANLQDTAIEKSAGVYAFNNGDSILASSLAQYNWIITRFYNVDGGVQNVRYNLFKPSEAVSGNRTIVQIDRSPVRYAEIKRDNGNILFRVVDESDAFDSGYVCTMKMWGIKLDGINATEVEYSSGVSVKQKLDEKVDIINLETTLETANYTSDRSPFIGCAGMAVPFKKSMINGYDIKTIKTNIITENVSLPINITISLLNSLSNSPSAEVITVRTIDTVLTANGEFEYNVNFTNEELPDNFLIGIRFKALSTGTGHLNLNVGTINSSWNSILGSMSPMYSNNGASVVWLYSYSAYKDQTMLLTLNKIKEIAYKEELTDYAKKNDYLSKTQLDCVDGGSGKLYQNNLLVKSSQLVVDNSIIDVPTSYDLVVGDTFELFYKGVIKATNIDDYIIEVVAPFGKALSRKFIANSITNANLGNNTLTLKVYDKYWNLLETKSTTLIVRSVLTSPLTNKNILCIGDSLTAGGEWVNELNRRLTSNTSIASNGDVAPLGLSLTNITFVGKEGTTVKHEGHSGWNYNSYITSGSPFMYSGVIDFQAYCTELGISGIDEVYILLGWNSWSVSLSTYKVQIKTLLDALITFNSSVKITLLGVQIPSQDGVGDDYGASTPNFRQLWNRVFEYNSLYKEVSNEYVNKVKFVNLSGQFDSEYNMPNSSVNPNIRNKVSTIIEGNNGVHPTIYGYYQIADAVYRAMHDTI